MSHVAVWNALRVVRRQSWPIPLRWLSRYMNHYRIPKHIEDTSRARDIRCVYCHRTMLPTSGGREHQIKWATIEHLDHLPPRRRWILNRAH